MLADLKCDIGDYATLGVVGEWRRASIHQSVQEGNCPLFVYKGGEYGGPLGKSQSPE